MCAVQQELAGFLSKGCVMTEVDLLVIGGGVAGTVAAKSSRNYEISVAIADPGRLGGT